MTVTRTPSRRRTITGAAGAAVAFAAAVVLTAGPVAAEVHAGGVAAVSADAHLAGESTTALDDPALAAKRRTTKSTTSDYLKVVLKEAG